MSLRIIVDMFSGRPNPEIDLSQLRLPKALSAATVRGLLSREPEVKAVPAALGLRGLIVEETNPKSNVYGRHRITATGELAQYLAKRFGTKSLEEFVLRSQKGALATEFQKAYKRFRALPRPVPKRAARRVPKVGCKCAPLYEPNWWNDAGQIQHRNNCYNYACNYRSDTFAQPGLAAGQIYQSLSCQDVHDAAVRDFLLDTSLKNECPEEGHLVALVVAPGFDFHWYRKGPDGLWTHKPGGTPVTNLDNSANPIPDPRTADRGPYTDFCSFMIVMHGHIKIA